MVNGSKIVYGSTITALVNFFIVAAVIYFVVVIPMNTIMARVRRDADAATPAPSDEARLLTEIRDLLAETR
jgi:large conductance mechanosensitive channel